MKLLFENWRGYLNEREQVDVSPEENQALKGLYLKIRELVTHFASWIEENPELDPSSGKIKNAIRKEYEPPAGFTKRNYNFSFDVSEFKSVFPILSDNFEVTLRPDLDSDGSTNAQLVRLKGEISSVEINTKNIRNISRIKQSIQHELQHILDFGADKGEGAEGTIDYLSSEGEVRAHAKEAAYYVFKNLPDAEEVDFEEVAGTKNTFANYYNFSTDPTAIVQRAGVDPSYEQKMKKAGDDFIKYANYFLNLYRNK
jgi:hypothetical protein